MYEYEKNCTLLVPTIIGTNIPTSSELQKKLEDPNDHEKCKALRELIIWMTQGESYNRLLMTVIRYVVQSNNHKVKKYLQLYWEVVEKCNDDGTLKEEMILVCNALRNDLQHPNEYIRGSTLRLLCNLRFIKLIQPLIESILENLQHRHSYVRRNAVMCIYSIIKTFGIDIIPNAVDEVEKLLLIEGDISTKRNAFLVLTYCDVERSLRYILSIQDNVVYMGDVIQMVLLELLGKIYCDYPNYRNNLLQLIINIVQSGSPAVSYEGANTLVKISHTSPNNTIKISIQAYINLLLTQSDNNIRYIVLNKISKITSITSALYTLQKCFVKDILRVLLCSNCYSLRIKVIEIVLKSLLTKTNCLDIFQFLLKHLQDVTSNSNNQINNKINNYDDENINNNNNINHLNNNILNHTYQYSSNIDLNINIVNDNFKYETNQLTEFQQYQQYQLVIIKSLHEITRKYHIITFKYMINVLVNFVSGNNPMIVHEITQFLKEMIINYPIYQEDIVDKIISQLTFMQFSKPLRTCLWILSECNYDDKEKIIKIIDIIYESLQPLPLLNRNNLQKDSIYSINNEYKIDNNNNNNNSNNNNNNNSTKKSNLITKTVVLEDGTYATQDIDYSNNDLKNDKSYNLSKINYLRNLIVKDEDLLLMANVGVSLIKLLLLPSDKENDKFINNLGISIYNKVLYTIVCFLKYCINDQKSGGLLNDTTHRLMHCYLIIKSLYNDLSNNQSDQYESYISLSKKTLLLKQKLFPKIEQIQDLNFIENINKENNINKNDKIINIKQPYQIVNFRQLKEKSFSNNVDVLQINDDDDDININIDNVNFISKNSDNYNNNSTLKRIYPITGLNDPIYIEAIVQVQHQDVLLELIVTNQNSKSIQNIQIELYPYGNLKIIEKPQNINHLEPGNVIHVYSIAQVKSIETGIIFGFVTFQNKNILNDNINNNNNLSISLNDIVVLNEISIDLIDFITNSNITSPLFRQLWSEFEWENKIPIHTNCDSFIQFLKHLIRETKLSIVGTNNLIFSRDENSHLFEMDENSSFFATNLYAKSIFGEDALVNISLEKQVKDEKDKLISGTVRIRSRTQGIALSLGDHIVSLQRKIPKDEKFNDDCRSFNHSQLLNINFGEIY